MNDLHLQELVRHALDNDCKDPDCELHNPDVALNEGVIGPTEVAYYYAGAMAMRDLITMLPTNDSMGLAFATSLIREQLRLPS